MRAKRKISAGTKALKLPIGGMAVLLVAIAIAFTSMSLTVAPVMAQQDEVTVTVNAPGYVEEGATFDVTIDVDSIENFNTGLFDLSFDPDVVKVENVGDGSIDGTTIPVVMWDRIGRDTIKVFLTVQEVAGVSGSGGYLAKIRFKVKGDEGDECVLDLSLSEGALANKDAEEIPAKEIDAKIAVGSGKEDKDDEQPPDITEWEPTEAVVSSTEGESMTFEITVDQEVDINWQINGTEVQTDEDETEAAFTKSAVAGTWNVSAIATNKETGLSSIHTWMWSVTSASAEASEGTPTHTRASEITPTPKTTATPSPSHAVKPTPTVKPTSTPKSEEATPTTTPTPETPGFEAVFALAAMSAIAYVLRRRR